MKKYLFLLILFCAAPLFSAELDYPVLMNNGTILINAGIGFGHAGPGPRRGEMLCPPLTVSIDYALPVAGLPFTFGLITGYFSEKKTYKDDLWGTETTEKYNFLPIAGRIGYHIPFNVPRLDTYALLTLGGMVSPKYYDQFWFGLGAGARYFFLPYLGAYAELSIDFTQVITFGVAFKL